MSKIQRITDLFDEHHEIMAWLTYFGAPGLLWAGKLGEWPTVACICFALITMLGSERYKGVKVGKDGVEISE